eukprot:TRINITY_DN2460_c0_g2_i1.p1 TRINITY_DN2460_c0_g2~~TRINITY_DN2460_c0_g2_i1.p1  ORF type:complete len:554 (+),score=143.54 TRINITY_DN2460_c0_g2_i1:88-1749(+)
MHSRSRGHAHPRTCPDGDEAGRSRLRARLRRVTAAAFACALGLWLVYPPPPDAGRRVPQARPLRRAPQPDPTVVPAPTPTPAPTVPPMVARLWSTPLPEEGRRGEGAFKKFYKREEYTAFVEAYSVAADLPDPGQEPDPKEGVPDAENQAALSEYELRRISHARAKYLHKAEVAHPRECLEGDAADEAAEEAWRSRMSGAGASLPLTEEVQQKIWRHQHPQDCQKARYLVWRLWNQGMGADLHKMADALHVAMQTDRVLILDAAFTWWYAMDREPATVGCFFVPLTNCTMDDVGQYEVLNAKFKMLKSRKTGLLKPQPTSHEAVKNRASVRAVANPLHINGYMHSSYAKSAEFEEYGAMWWYAQALRYFLRTPQPWLWAQYKASVAEIFPAGVPAKMVGIHVRHGDKHTEMKLHQLADYVEAADRWRRDDPGLQDIFLSTEDDAVLAETEKYPQWRFHWTKHLRFNEGSPMDYAMLIGPSKLAEISFVNLLISEQLCTHWVGTDQSNWNRMINELRLTNGKLYNPYHRLNSLDCKGAAKPFDPPAPGWVKGCP